MATLASIQETTLDVAWIRDGVICFGNRPAEHCERAVLTIEGPPEAFAVEANRVQPAVDAYASFLNGLATPLCSALSGSRSRFATNILPDVKPARCARR